MKRIHRRRFLEASLLAATALAVPAEKRAAQSNVARAGESGSPKAKTRFLTFAQQAVDILLEKQSAQLGGAPDGVRFITATGRTMRTYGSLGGSKGAYRVARFTTQPLESNPVRLDFGAWPLLEGLTAATGERRYAQRVETMAATFAEHGFETKSGLGYLGVQADFDVVRLQPLPVLGIPQLLFKPEADLPLERLWTASPEKMGRMFKSAYYACVTQPETMAYNRYGPYGFDDSLRKPALKFSPHHSAFALSGACLIHWWCIHHARTGDAESLQWSRRMMEKWRAVQHPESGLIPHYFGTDDRSATSQPPMPYVNYGDSRTAILWLSAARELAGRPDAQPLARELSEMGLRLLRGFARFGYNRESRLFPRWLHLDGRQCRETVRLAFMTQAEKDAALAQNPDLADVPVYVGAGFYSDGPWTQGVHGSHLPFVPHDLAEGAALTSDPALLTAAERIAMDAMEAARMLSSGFTGLEQWTYSATASYIKMMVSLHGATRDRKYLEWASQLADMEMEFLRRERPPGQPEWWRMSFRNHLVDAFLRLHRAIVA